MKEQLKYIKQIAKKYDLTFRFYSVGEGAMNAKLNEVSVMPTDSLAKVIHTMHDVVKLNGDALILKAELEKDSGW